MNLFKSRRKAAGALVSFGLAAFLSGCMGTDGDSVNSTNPCADLGKLSGDKSHTLRIGNPNGGETRRVGDELTITMCADSAAMSDLMVNLAWSVDGGESWLDVPGMNDGSIRLSERNTYTFTIPESQTFTRTSDYEPVVLSTVTKKALIRVYEYVDNSMKDESDAPFTIDRP